MAAKKRGAKPAERNAAGCEAARARSDASGISLEHELHTAHTILDVQGKVAGLLGLRPRTRNALLIAVQPLAAQVGVALGLPSTGRVTRELLPSSEVNSRAPSEPRPTPVLGRCVKPSASRSSMCSAGPRFVDRAPAEVVATLLDEGHYLCSERTMYRILAADQPVTRASAISASIPSTRKPAAGGHGAEPDLVLGHHQAVGADQVDVLLPLRRARHLQPLRGRLDGRRPGELGDWPVVSSKRPATNRASSPRCSPCTPTAARR